MLKSIRELDVQNAKQAAESLCSRIGGALDRAWAGFAPFPIPGGRERFKVEGFSVQLDLLQALLFVELYHTGLLFSVERDPVNDSDFVVYVWKPELKGEY